MKDRIIILKATKYSDHHLIITGITPSGSKKSFLAPAALKSKKRFGGGVLEPSHYIEIQFKEPKNEELLPVLQEAQIIEGFEGLRTSYDKLEAAFQILKYVEKVSQEELDDNENLFKLVGHALRALENSKYPAHLVSHFEIKLLHFIGVLNSEESLSKIIKASFSNQIIFNENTLSQEGTIQYEVSKREYLLS